MKNKFNIGDRVVGTKKADKNCAGREGRVIAFSGECVGVEFDEFIGGHTCNLGGGAKGKDGHCWWAYSYEIKHVQPARVIFNGNATVLIKGGKKYVSKCNDGDTYDKEKGLLLCLAQANGISYRDLQEMIAGAKDCNDHKKADDKAQVREVKRKAEAGEYIKIVKAYAAYDLYNNGDILKVYKLHNKSGVYCDMPKKAKCGFPVNDNGNIVILHSEYVVLENYKPYKITLSEFWANEGKKVMAIHCKTEGEAKELLKAFNGIGKRWRDGSNYTEHTYHNEYKEKTVYDNTHGYCDVGGGFCTRKNAQIFEFNEVDLEN